jgi:hypothetical protein
MLKKLAVLLTIGLLVFGCSPSEKTDGETPQQTQSVPGTDSDVTITYTMKVSGIPMMAEMTFNQKYLSDGTIGRVEMESIIPVGEDTRISKFSTIVDVDNRVVHYVNDVSKTFKTIPFPDSLITPPATSPEMTISVEPNGQVDTIAGIECNGIDLALEISFVAQDQPVKSTMSGTLWTSGDFPGYASYQAFQEKTKNALPSGQMQSGGFLDFLTKFGMSRENLDSLYASMSGFPFAGDLVFTLNKGLPNGFDLNTKLEVTEVNTDAIDRALFTVPEDYTESEVMQIMMPSN